MKKWEQFWEDVKNGKNIDLYLTIIIAVGLSVLNLLGVAPQPWISSIILAALGILSISQLLYRYNTKKSFNMMNEIYNIVKDNKGELKEYRIQMENFVDFHTHQSIVLRHIETSYSNILSNFILSQSVVESGLCDIIWQSRKIDWDKIFENVKEIDLFLALCCLVWVMSPKVNKLSP